jgi:hypothetical protein
VRAISRAFKKRLAARALLRLESRESGGAWNESSQRQPKDAEFEKALAQTALKIATG